MMQKEGQATGNWFVYNSTTFWFSDVGERWSPFEPQVALFGPSYKKYIMQVTQTSQFS